MVERVGADVSEPPTEEYPLEGVSAELDDEESRIVVTLAGQVPITISEPVSVRHEDEREHADEILEVASVDSTIRLHLRFPHYDVSTAADVDSGLAADDGALPRRDELPAEEIEPQIAFDATPDKIAEELEELEQEHRLSDEERS